MTGLWISKTDASPSGRLGAAGASAEQVVLRGSWI